ncbi:hypothetical protein ADUPG1_000694, partial [Aduncisulcus paluster]
MLHLENKKSSLQREVTEVHLDIRKKKDRLKSQIEKESVELASTLKEFQDRAAVVKRKGKAHNDWSSYLSCAYSVNPHDPGSVSAYINALERELVGVTVLTEQERDSGECIELATQILDNPIHSSECGLPPGVNPSTFIRNLFRGSVSLMILAAQLRSILQKMKGGSAIDDGDEPIAEITDSSSRSSSRVSKTEHGDSSSPSDSSSSSSSVMLALLNRARQTSLSILDRLSRVSMDPTFYDADTNRHKVCISLDAGKNIPTDVLDSEGVVHSYDYGNAFFCLWIHQKRRDTGFSSNVSVEFKEIGLTLSVPKKILHRQCAIRVVFYPCDTFVEGEQVGEELKEELGWKEREEDFKRDKINLLLQRASSSCSSNIMDGVSVEEIERYGIDYTELNLYDYSQLRGIIDYLSFKKKPVPIGPLSIPLKLKKLWRKEQKEAMKKEKEERKEQEKREKKEREAQEKEAKKRAESASSRAEPKHEESIAIPSPKDNAKASIGHKSPNGIPEGATPENDLEGEKPEQDRGEEGEEEAYTGRKLPPLACAECLYAPGVVVCGVDTDEVEAAALKETYEEGELTTMVTEFRKTPEERALEAKQKKEEEERVQREQKKEREAQEKEAKKRAESASSRAEPKHEESIAIPSPKDNAKASIGHKSPNGIPEGATPENDLEGEKPEQDRGEEGEEEAYTGRKLPPLACAECLYAPGVVVCGVDTDEVEAAALKETYEEGELTTMVTEFRKTPEERALEAKQKKEEEERVQRERKSSQRARSRGRSRPEPKNETDDLELNVPAVFDSLPFAGCSDKAMEHKPVGERGSHSYMSKGCIVMTSDKFKDSKIKIMKTPGIVADPGDKMTGASTAPTGSALIGSVGSSTDLKSSDVTEALQSSDGSRRASLASISGPGSRRASVLIPQLHDSVADSASSTALPSPKGSSQQSDVSAIKPTTHFNPLCGVLFIDVLDIPPRIMNVRGFTVVMNSKINNKDLLPQFDEEEEEDLVRLAQEEQERKEKEEKEKEEKEKEEKEKGRRRRRRRREEEEEEEQKAKEEEEEKKKKEQEEAKEAEAKTASTLRTSQKKRKKTREEVDEEEEEDDSPLAKHL